MNLLSDARFLNRFELNGILSQHATARSSSCWERPGGMDSTVPATSEAIWFKSHSDSLFFEAGIVGGVGLSESHLAVAVRTLWLNALGFPCPWHPSMDAARVPLGV